MTSDERQSYRARWIVPVASDPIANGTIGIESRRIVELHASDDPETVDLGNVAIIPGLVNAHTHLEFSDLNEPLQPDASFTDWIRTLVSYRRTRTVTPPESAKRGYDESACSGTTLLGEIATEGWQSKAFAGDGPRVVVFREILGLDSSRIDEQLDLAKQHLGLAPPISPAISPHAPYSVHPELFHGLVGLAKEARIPLAIHLAETCAELKLLESGEGPIVEMLRGFGVWRDGIFSNGTRPFDYLKAMAGLEQVLIVHGNYLSDDEIDFLAEHPEMTVVYCPRTHAFFGHDEHPWRQMLERGVSLAIGTDSRASNPDLSLWNELKFLYARFPDVNPAKLLELGTINGARALGLDALTGSLAPGKSADLAVVALGQADDADPYRTLFVEQNQITRTMCRGNWVEPGTEELRSK